MRDEINNTGWTVYGQRVSLSLSLYTSAGESILFRTGYEIKIRLKVMAIYRLGIGIFAKAERLGRKG